MTHYVVAWTIIGAVAWSQGLRVARWAAERRAQRKAERAAWDRERRLHRLIETLCKPVKPSPVAIRLDMWNLAANDLLAADLLIERIKETRNV